MEMVRGGIVAPAEFVERAHVDAAGYQQLYAQSLNDPTDFWGEQGHRIDWMRDYTKVKDTSFARGAVSIKWFEDGTHNVSANCIDRHMVSRANQTAIIWEPDDPRTPARHITYAELLEQTSRLANVLKAHGVRKGDRVVLYMPMIPEAAEVESALVGHEKVAQAAVVGYPHDIKGQGIYAYVTLMNGVEPTEALRKELEAWVCTEIGPIAKPDLIQWAPGLPKTRSGKIMRRILRKIAENDYGALGDTSTLADPSVVEDLIDNRMVRD
jgi:hypothetical protein